MPRSCSAALPPWSAASKSPRRALATPRPAPSASSRTRCLPFKPIPHTRRAAGVGVRRCVDGRRAPPPSPRRTWKAARRQEAKQRALVEAPERRRMRGRRCWPGRGAVWVGARAARALVSRTGVGSPCRNRPRLDKTRRGTATRQKKKKNPHRNIGWMTAEETKAIFVIYTLPSAIPFGARAPAQSSSAAE